MSGVMARLSEGDFLGVEAILRLQDGAETQAGGVDRRGWRRGGDGLADELFGDVVLVALMRQHAQEMQGVGLIGEDFEDLAVDVFGLGELAFLLVLKGDLQGLVDGELAHGMEAVSG